MGIFRRGKSADQPVEDTAPSEENDLAESGLVGSEVDQDGAPEDSARIDASSRSDADADADAMDNDAANDQADDQTDDQTGDQTDDQTGDAADEDNRSGRPALHRSVSIDRSNGPYDRSEVDSLDGRINLGSLCLSALPGMELRLDLDTDQESIVGATAVVGQAAVQLQAFAAPRSQGIWDEIRTEIAQSVTSRGGTAQELHGPLGWELRTRMPTRGPNNRTTFMPARFIGVDGPRWFLRAVLTGTGAVQDEVGDALLGFVRGSVIDRGSDAMPPREVLPLRLPEEIAPGALPGDGADSVASRATAQDNEPVGAAGIDDMDNAGDLPNAADPAGTGDPVDGGAARRRYSTDDLKPFERGPEITETR